VSIVIKTGKTELSFFALSCRKKNMTTIDIRKIKR
jgi:hypothetical protein